MKRIRLTKREMQAIEEALSSRLAGEIDVGEDSDTPDVEDYEAAHDKIVDMLAKRKR